MQALEFWKTVVADKVGLLERLLGLLRDHGIRYCVVGGQAVNAYADPVVSIDLDLVMAVDQRGRAEGLLRQAEPMPTVVWFSARDGCCVAEARCPLINFYCEAGHLQRWRAEHAHELGTALTLMDAVEVGKAIFGELLT